MLYAHDPQALELAHQGLRAQYGPGVREVYVRDTEVLPERKEHFGFVDGISQPRIAGYAGDKTDKSSAATAAPGLAAGEFVLGYANEYGKLPSSPKMAGSRDLGRNGTYLVFRQLDQDVPGFWRNLLARAGGNRSEAVRLAAKCVGRWPSGAPLVRSPTRDDPSQGDVNDFGYANEDPKGTACPFGAHIRRSNPRDALPATQEESLELARRHALVRRGRSYGEPLAPFTSEAVPKERGLLFICVNANIGRQFEFVQQTWINNPKFAGLYDERDPLLGDHEQAGGTFTIPAAPFRERLRDLPRFTRVRGGAYFFLPSLRALRLLVSAERKTPQPPNETARPARHWHPSASEEDGLPGVAALNGELAQ